MVFLQIGGSSGDWYNPNVGLESAVFRRSRRLGKLQRRYSAKTNLVHSSLFACTGKKKGRVMIRCGAILNYF
ncbi:hypothetical protein U1Q18_022348 [Sarracenia purpurea var. burkii]